ncbi:GNAT family N-acetyltransferase [Sphaerotilus microaerophilus]|jgi:GNAT superfamily N-acetyltransferase|uniref:N-acetyltransferase domain-containing protein n=1 Tax=Sphaerotilus microaerophilus TaxID=2914710 RepID=A0ABM7YQR4_9BURK|nr:GNAT family N-acetyltransferase [Sphaerotilus sp. FB-5]BDI06897.1 hypothetical protein CATMQ487_38670 [Sphaerotilus sp. FB-5]
MKPPRPPGKIQALGAATVQALHPQRALEAVRKLKAAHERRTDARANVQLRRATVADLPALAVLHRATGLDGRSPPDGYNDDASAGTPAPTLERAWAAMEAAGAQVWLAECEGELLGALTLYLLPLLLEGGSRSGWVDDLVVHPGAHHLAIPRRLITLATGLAREAGASKLALAPRRKAGRGTLAATQRRSFLEHLVHSRHGRRLDLPPAPDASG